MNRQKHFKVDPFLCFRRGHVVRKSCEKSAESETRGGSFREYCRKETDVYGGEKEEESRMASNEQQLGRPCDPEHGRQGDREVRGREVV
jgi:hypothetical protein